MSMFDLTVPVKEQLSKGGIIDFKVIAATLGDNNEVLIDFENEVDKFSWKVYQPKEEYAGSDKTFHETMRRLLVAFQKPEGIQKYGQADSYEEMANNIVNAINDSKVKDITLKIVINQKNGYPTIWPTDKDFVHNFSTELYKKELKWNPKYDKDIWEQDNQPNDSLEDALSTDAIEDTNPF